MARDLRKKEDFNQFMRGLAEKSAEARSNREAAKANRRTVFEPVRSASERTVRDERRPSYNNYSTRQNRQDMGDRSRSASIRESSTVVSDLASWAKKIRTSESGEDLKNAAQKSNEYKRYFSENRNKFDPATMSQVTKLLDLTDAEIRNKTKTVPKTETKTEQKKSPFVTGSVSEADMMRNLAEQDKVRQGEKAFERKVKQDAYNAKEAEYLDLKNRDDFLEKSQYKKTDNPALAKNALYEYINKNEDVRKLANEYGYAGDTGDIGFSINNDKTFIEQMSDDEVRTYNYLDATEGRESANDYLRHLRSQLTGRQREETTSMYEQMAKDEPVASSIASVLMKPFSAYSYAGQAADLIATGEIDQNASYNQYSYVPTAVRNKVSENFGTFGKFAYQTGMSMADFLYTGLMTGSFGGGALGLTGTTESAVAQNLMLGIMGSNAAADKVIEAKDNGLDDGEAFALGTVAGVSEVLTEKVSVDALLDDIPRLGKNLVGYIAKNTLAEGSEEVASDLINLVADIAISKDKSEWKKSVQAYVDQGYTESEAFGLAMADQAKQMGMSFAGGALSGGFMGGGAIAGSALTDAWLNAGQSDINYATSGAAGMTGSDAAQMQRESAQRILQAVAAQQAEKEEEKVQSTEEAAEAWEVKNAELHPEEVVAEAEQEAQAAEDPYAEIDRIALRRSELQDKADAIYQNGNEYIDRHTGRTVPVEEVVQLSSDLDRANREYEAAVARIDMVESGTQPEVNPVEAAAEEAVEAAEPSEFDQRVAEFSAQVDKQDEYGTKGKEAVKELYGTVSQIMEQDNISPQEQQDALTNIISAYDAVYTAGKTGGNLDARSVNLLSSVSPNLVLKAWDAGTMDAYISKAQAINEAKDENVIAPDRKGRMVAFQNSEAGVVDSTELLDAMNSGRLNQETYDKFNTFGKLTGTRINFVNKLKENAQYDWDTGEVTVSIDADFDKTMDFYLGHEFTHRLEQASPEEYQTLVDTVKKSLTDERLKKDAWTKAVEDYRALYNRRGIEITDKVEKNITNEVVADYVGQMLNTDSTVLDDFIRQHVGTKQGRTLMQRLRNFFREMARKFHGNGQSRKYSEVEKVLSKALQGTYESTQAMLNERQAAREQTIQSEAEELSDANLQYSVRQEAPPKKTGTAYKVFLAKNGQLYPPMVANPNGEGTPIGIWLNADAAPLAGLSKTGRPQVQAGGKGTNVGKQTLAYRPGWHLGDIPLAKQFAKVNPETGMKELFPENFVWAECEYAMDVDYQSEADEMGYMRTNPDGSYYKAEKYQHALAGLKKIPKDGYYHYRTNPNPDTVPWVITGAMKVNRILDDNEVAEICRENGVEPMQRKGGPIDLSQYGLSNGKVQNSTRKDMDDDWLDALDIEDIISELELSVNNAEPKKRAERRVDEVNKELKKIGLQFNGTTTAAWTDERIDKYLGGGYYGSTDPNYAQAHITYMSPMDFLKLTAGSNVNTINRIQSKSSEYGDLDIEEIGDSDPIMLSIDKKRTGADVVGHEGRHRMMLLGKAGFKEIPVLIFDSADKNSKTDLHDYTLRPQTFGQGGLISKSRNVTVKEMIPFSQGNRDRIIEKFGSGNQEASVRYSARKDSTGKQLTEAQAEYFKDSKAVDKDGNLLTLYHGTPSAGFTVFRPGLIWMTTSRRDADSYAGNWEKKLFDPNEKETATDARTGNYSLKSINEYLADYHFDSQEDLDKFVKDHPGIERVADEDTLDDQNYDGEITDEEYDDLIDMAQKIRKDYAYYNLNHSTIMTLGDVLDAPKRFDKWSLEQALYAFDRNAEVYDEDTAESLGEAILSIAEETAAEEGEEWLQDFRSVSFKSRIPVGENGQYISKTNQRTYALYANVTNPLIVDAHQRYMSEGYYSYVDKAVNGDYDGAIIRNVRVGRYKDVGDVVIAFDSNQVKSVTNENPTDDPDIRYSTRKDSTGKTLTQIQAEYFKDSKVVDENGNLLAVYHGSPATDITVFDRDLSGTHTGAYSDRAIWFTNSQPFAEDFSYEFEDTGSNLYTRRGAQGSVYAGYLNMTKPFDLTNPTQEVLDVLYDADNKEHIDKLLDIGNHQLIKQYIDYDQIEDLGFDGVIAKTSVNGDEIEYGIFNANQIKSAENDNPTDSPDIRFSTRSMLNSAGFNAELIDGRVKLTLDGNEVTEVTSDHIKNSGLGAVIKLSLDSNNITQKEYDEQIDAAADLMNMILTMQDPELVWEWAGASMFSAIKSNSDGQYGTTVDFTTICRKTQEMVTAMSEAMKEKKRGLTKDEVAALQKKVYESGATVPCPVCYVFSRWAGVGAILDGIYKWQEKYTPYTEKQVEAAIKELENMDAQTKRARLAADDPMYQMLQKNIEDLEIWNAEQKEGLKALRQSNPELADIREQTIKDNEERVKKLKAESNKLVSRMSAELAWLKNVRNNPKWTPKENVEPDILFDLDKGEVFAEKHPLTWKYRTTRGPSAGKAILPYSDMRLGDMITGPGKGNTFGKVTDGEFTKQQRNKITRALARTRAQNIIGGQRFQSTSDYRSEYALDYLQVFWEAQALGSNMQTYTKVVEFADIVAAVGGDCNLSVMGQGQGFAGDKDKLIYDPKTGMYSNGRLKFSSVTGMDIDAAIKANRMHDSVQLILVGINDAHVRLALSDAVDADGNSVTGGSEIGFVIPWHASGNADAFIAELVRNLGESYTKSNYQDYSRVQEDHENADATADQIRRRELRKQLLKGKKGSKKWTPSADDIAFLKGKNKDIRHRSFEDLLETERKALAGDPDALDDYESWSEGVLWDLYQNMWVDSTNDFYWYTNPINGKRLPIRLNGAQSGSVMPHEYWNTSVDRAHAYVNGFIFRSYAHSLGLTPRFTGYASDGKVDFGDFTDCSGYWKTLIDRPMYDNNGNYRAQNKINVSNLKKEMLSDQYAKTNWEEYYTQVPDKARAKETGKAFAQSLNDTAQFSMRGSTNIVSHAQTVTETAAMQQRINDLQKEVENLKGEFKSNKGYKANVSEAHKTARRILDGYGVDAIEAGIDVKELGDNLAKMANQLARTPAQSYEDVRAELTKLAYDIIWNGRETVDVDENVSDVKKIIRNAKIYVDPSTRDANPDFDADIRKAYMGKMTITYDSSKGQALDSLYDELSGMYPYLFPEDVLDPTEQLNNIINVLDNRNVMQWMAYDEYGADTVEQVTNDLIDEVLNVAGVKNPDTFADKKNKQIAKARQKGKEDVKRTKAEMRQRINRLRADKNAKLDEVKAYYREQKIKARTRRQTSEARENLLKTARDLEKMKTTGENRKKILQALGNLDSTAQSISNKTLSNLVDLRHWVQDMIRSTDGDYLIDSNTMKKLERLERIESQIIDAGKTLEEVIESGEGWDQFSTQQFDSYDNSLDFMLEYCDVLKALETQIRNEKKTIDTEDKRDVFEQGLATISAVQNSWGINSMAAKFIDRWIFTEAARPSTEMLRIVGYNEDAPLYQRFLDLTRGQRNMVDYARRANERYFDRFTNDKEFQRTVSGKHAREIEITGIGDNGRPVTVKVTPDLLMSMYMHSQNDQNVRHIMEGGMTVPDIKLYKAGKINEAYDSHNTTKIRLKKSELQQYALNNMTQKERAFCEAAKSYYKNMSQPELNEVSEKLVGYEIAKVDNYYRIVTDPNWMHTNLDGMQFDGTIEGMGFTKDRVKMASNPVQLLGIINQVTTDIKMHSKYIGMAIPVRNFSKVLGVTSSTYNDKGKIVTRHTGSVQETIGKKWGDAANNYIGKMLRDLQNPPRSTDYTYKQFFSKVRSHYAGAVLTINASVAIKQAASYPTAAAVLGWEPLAKAITTFPKTKGKSGAFIAQYSPLMRLRMEGYVSQETGDILSSGKSLPKAANWIQMVDIGTVRLLWLASEYSVKKSNPELKYGTKEFYEKVGELHTKVIEDTQPNYTELQRAQVLRSDSELVRMLNMFKTQPLQNFNILLEGFGQYRAKKIQYLNNPNEQTLAAKKEAGVKLRRAVTSQVAAAAVFAAMQWIWDLFRGKTDKYKDKEGEESLPGWLRGVGLNMLTSFAGMIPTFGNTLLEFGESTTDAVVAALGDEDTEPVFNQKYYGLDASSSLENINTLLTGATETITNFIGLGREIFATAESGVEPDWEKYLRDIFENGIDMAQFFGVPSNNIKNEVIATIGQAAKAKDGEYIGQYAMLRCGTGITSQNKKQYYELLYKAYEHDKDSNPRYGGQYQKLYDMMIQEDGFATSSKTAQENIDAKMADYLAEQGIDPAADARAEQGIDSATYQAALDMYDADKNGKYKQEEVYAALNSLNLSDSQKEYLWAENKWKKTYAEYAKTQNKSKSRSMPMGGFGGRPVSREETVREGSAGTYRRESIGLKPDQIYAREMEHTLKANPEYEFPSNTTELEGELMEMGIEPSDVGDIDAFYKRAKNAYDAWKMAKMTQIDKSTR